jgi:hypothetical protein
VTKNSLPPTVARMLDMLATLPEDEIASTLSSAKCEGPVFLLPQPRAKDPDGNPPDTACGLLEAILRHGNVSLIRQPLPALIQYDFDLLTAICQAATYWQCSRCVLARPTHIANLEEVSPPLTSPRLSTP